MPKLRGAHRRGFTLVEAVVATAITVIAGSALLLGIAGSVTSTNDALHRSLAIGMAQQLMDEIAAQKYCEDPANPYQYPLTPSAYEAAGVCRERFNDIDDYNAFATQPPKDRWGVLLGTDDGTGKTRNPNFRVASTTFANWDQSVSVYYVSSTNHSQALPAGQTSSYRAVEVGIYCNDPVQGRYPLASLRRVFAYVPPQ